MTPQSKYQQSRKAKGLCVMCGKPTDGLSTRCPPCRNKTRIRHRKLRHCKPWHKGGRGRPPVEAI